MSTRRASRSTSDEYVQRLKYDREAYAKVFKNLVDIPFPEEIGRLMLEETRSPERQESMSMVHRFRAAPWLELEDTPLHQSDFLSCRRCGETSPFEPEDPTERSEVQLGNWYLAHHKCPVPP